MHLSLKTRRGRFTVDKALIAQGDSSVAFGAD